MIKIKKFSKNNYAAWDSFVLEANNGTLFHLRKFLSYHPEDRFKDHSVFVGYAPIENPKYIVSVIIENGGSGSAVAAPIAHKILNFAYQENV